MTSITSGPPRFTVADLEAIPQPLDDTRYELIDGELYVTTQPHWRHQYTCASLAFELGSWNRQTKLGVILVAPGVIFAGDTNVAPDVVWIAQERLARVLRDDGKLHGAPDLVVEVLSPGPQDEARDRDLKLKLYSRQGVREYWLLSWQDRTAQVYRRVDAELKLAVTLTATDTLTSPLLPGFACPVDSLFEPS